MYCHLKILGNAGKEADVKYEKIPNCLTETCRASRMNIGDKGTIKVDGRGFIYSHVHAAWWKINFNTNFHVTLPSSFEPQASSYPQ